MFKRNSAKKAGFLGYLCYCFSFCPLTSDFATACCVITESFTLAMLELRWYLRLFNSFGHRRHYFQPGPSFGEVPDNGPQFS